MRIVFATGNKDKMKEIRRILGDLDAEILSMKEAGVFEDVVEDGTTFSENAAIKASAIYKLLEERTLRLQKRLWSLQMIQDLKLIILAESLESIQQDILEKTLPILKRTGS